MSDDEVTVPSIYVPEQICLACKVASTPVPSGDLGVLFISGFVTGAQLGPETRFGVIEGFCQKHRRLYDAFRMVDAGMLGFLGIKA